MLFVWCAEGRLGLLFSEAWNWVHPPRSPDGGRESRLCVPVGQHGPRLWLPGPQAAAGENRSMSPRQLACPAPLGLPSWASHQPQAIQCFFQNSR